MKKDGFSYLFVVKNASRFDTSKLGGDFEASYEKEITPVLCLIRTAIRSEKIMPGFHRLGRQRYGGSDKGGQGRQGDWKVLSIVLDLYNAYRR